MTVQSTSLDLQAHGAQFHPAAVASGLADLRAVLNHLPEDQAGIRIIEASTLRRLIEPDGSIGSIAAKVLGHSARAVRAILFNKTGPTNWSLGWHQDRTICVRQRVEVPGFGPWTRKAGMHHVAPPFDLLARMVTLRVHLDDVPTTNAPLLIAPGSHLVGRIAVDAVDEVVRRCGIHVCTAEAGDVWSYATPILHASEPAGIPARRRVLQLDYAAGDLPGGLEWAGV